MNIAIIFAGGVGSRMSTNALPKQFMKVNGVPIIIHTLNIFENNPQIDKIYISILASYREILQNMLTRYGISKVCGIVNGGDTSHDSIYNALKRAEEENPGDSTVLIHDGVRPIVTDAVIERNIAGVAEHGCAVTCSPCTETIIVSHDAQGVEDIPSRDLLYMAQAPQSFLLKDILAAHETLRASDERYTGLVDSCSVYRKVYGKVHLVRGNYGNIKVTRPGDVYTLHGLLQYLDATNAFGIGEYAHFYNS